MTGCPLRPRLEKLDDRDVPGGMKGEVLGAVVIPRPVEGLDETFPIS